MSGSVKFSFGAPVVDHTVTFESLWPGEFFGFLPLFDNNRSEIGVCQKIGETTWLNWDDVVNGRANYASRCDCAAVPVCKVLVEKDVTITIK